MARISSAGYVTALLQFLQAYNRGDLDACEALLDADIEWLGLDRCRGRRGVREMLETLAERYKRPAARPDDFRVASGRVLLIVWFYDSSADGLARDLRQSWIAELSDEGLIRRVMSYTSAAEAARAFEALAQKVNV